MAASKTEIANIGLQLVGSKRVANIDPADPTKGARAMSFVYDHTRKMCLRQSDWNFAGKEASIAKDGTDPTWVFDNRYAFPVDCLAVREINSTAKWEVIGRFIYTDAGDPLEIKYTYDNEVVTDFDELFVEYLAYSLALAVVEELTQSGTKQDRLRARLEDRVWELAGLADGAEGTPDDAEVDDWIVARA